MRPRKTRLKIFLIALLVFIVMALSSCQGIFFIPGADFGYYVTEDGQGKVNIQWSIDRRESDFTGWVSSDGTIEDYQTLGFEEDDTIEIEDGRLVFDAELSPEDYSDGIILDLGDYSYIEMELKINDGYDLERVHLGTFLNNPKNGIFRLDRDDLQEASDIPAYKRPPLSGLLYKLKADPLFVLIFIFVIGVIILEIVRITSLRRKRRYIWILIPLYAVLAALMAAVYLLLRNLKF